MSNHIVYRDVSLRPQDLIPANDLDDEDVAWREYSRVASTVNRQHILDSVLSSLDTDDSPLYGLIDSCLKEPQEPGRARESLTVLAALGQALLDLVAASVDDVVNLRMMTSEDSHGA